MTTPVYSHLFSCLYDESSPIGHLGRGTHYSVFRCVEWLNVLRRPNLLPEVHDFAVVWDEDHDDRVIKLVEKIYMEGLLSPIQFIGERKGSLTVIVAAKFYFAMDEGELADYIQRLAGLAQEGAYGDMWTLNLGYFDRHFGSVQTDLKAIIHAEPDRVETYIKNVDSLWRLGTRPFESE